MDGVYAALSGPQEMVVVEPLSDDIVYLTNWLSTPSLVKALSMIGVRDCIEGLSEVKRRDAVWLRLLCVV